MATNKTQNLKLNSWIGTDGVKREEINENFTKIDSKLGSVDAQLTGMASKSELTAVSGQIADKASKAEVTQLADNVSKRDFVRHGLLKLPSGFPKRLPFDLYRDSDGKIKHNFDISKEIKGVEVFVNEETGNDTTKDGLSSANPVRSLAKAIEIANAQVGTDAIINVTSRVLSRNYSGAGAYTFNKNITIRATNAFNEAILANSEYFTALTWTADGSAYKTTRSSTLYVSDIIYKDYRGVPKLLKKVNSVAECQAEKGTWYTDNTTVWVRRFNDEVPDKNVLVILATASLELTLGNNKLILQNIKIMKATISTANTDMLRLWGSPGSTFIAENSAYCLASKNGIATINVDNVYQFNCTSHSNAIDGMNYHGLGGANPTEFIFEYNCHSYKNGTPNLSGTYNATTCHDGMTVLRVNCVGYDCHGPVLADVNGCFSVNYDCNMYDSLLPSGAVTKSAFYFDNAAAVKQGKIYLINCGGGGIDTYSINSDKLININVKNFLGNNIPANNQINYIA